MPVSYTHLSAVEHFIRKQGAVPSFLHYNGYPASACISVNDEIIHGIPGKRVLQEGDIVSVDVGAYIDGFHGDCAATFACGSITPEAQDLIDVTRQSFFEGIRYAKEGHRLLDISAAIETYVESHGSVSYTHLDVYKRQDAGTAMAILMQTPKAEPEPQMKLL